MRERLSSLMSFSVVNMMLVGAAAAVDVTDTRLLSDPTVSESHVAFAYAGDLWLANRDGSGVRRLTSHVGNESAPRFSPDGKTVAFSGEYDGNVDVFVVPVEGGIPTRLTWHPGGDRVQGFTRDGAAVLFTSPRSVYTRRHVQLFTVPLKGGIPERLPIPYASKATYSPDGSHLAYVPLYEAFRQWKNYRGGTTSRIWLYDAADHSVEQIPQPEGRCNDTDPMWIGDTVYFISDRNGEFNLFSCDTRSKSVEQLTHHEDFPIQAASAGAGAIIYEQAGYLHLFDPRAGKASRLQIGVAAELLETRARFADGGEFIRSAHISPSGARAVFETRGEIVTVPAKKGDPRNLTASVAAHERLPAWSPDGRSIAYFSDASGEYQLYVAPQDGKGEVKTYELGGSGFYDDPKWSPDGKKISYSDNSWSLYWLDLETERVTKVSSEVLYGPIKTLSHSWAPDSRWLVYTRNTMSNFQTVHVYSLEQSRSFAITDGLSDVGEPVFDASGKYLYYFASTDAGPVRQWFAMSNADMEISGSLYLVVLQRGEPSPLAKESDEEEGPSEEEDEEGKEGEDEKKDADEELRVRIDFEGLDQRIVALPLDEGAYSSLQAGAEGKLFYLKSGAGAGLFGDVEETKINCFDLKEREEKTLLTEVDSFALSQDGKKLLYTVSDSWFIADAKDEIESGKGKLDVGAIKLRIDPLAEWPQIFDEAWRINRDYFYDPNMHGADWPAMREKYATFLPHVASRDDLNRVIQWMCSELAVGHHRVRGGDYLAEADRVPGGLLGADFEIHEGRYRFAKVYGGLNWNPELRSPLTEPGVDVRAGEYLLAVAGAELRPPENVFARFENTADRIVEITVGPDPGGVGARTVEVVPNRNEAALRNRDWVEGNIAKVHEATGGRVAYVYVPNTTSLGHTYFKRYFFPQAQKEAIIVDERHNGGGQVADYYIDLLRRPYISHWNMRYGEDLRTPQAAILGPKVMLIDETAGSGGDMLPWMFAKLELGTLIGKRTWGGLVGTLGFPELMDGGYVSAPNLAIWTEEGGFVVENVGVPPDIEVEQLPVLVIDGHDPQLEKAIEVVMEQLEADPPAEPRRPPYPIRVRR